jgi:hypothetical protein
MPDPARLVALAVAVLVLPGCVAREVSDAVPRRSGEQHKEIPVNLSRDLDILFVIDNSISMGQEQDSLARNFPRFIEVLENLQGGLPDLHIAVVSSDLGIGGLSDGNCSGDGDAGRFRLGEGDACLLTDGKRYLTTAPANYEGTLADAFSCIARLGDQGCGFEQHLESMKAALAAPDPGFLRRDAYLVVVVVADEDDCSARPARAAELFARGPDDDSGLGYFTSFRCWEYGVVCNDDDPAPRDMPADGTPSQRADCVSREDSPYLQDVRTYVDFLKSLKADPNRVIVAGIVGDPTPVAVRRRNLDGDPALEHELVPSCLVPGAVGEPPTTEAAPATRLAQFVRGFPNRSTLQTICAADGDLTGALAQIAETLPIVLGLPCLDGQLTDVDPDLAGVQPDCRVSDVQYYNTDQAVETSIPPCELAAGATPCYTIVPSAECSQFPTGLAIDVDHGGGQPPAETTRVVRCLLD